MTRISAYSSAPQRAPRASSRNRFQAPPRTGRVALAFAAGTLVLAGSGLASAQDLGGTFPFPSSNVGAGLTTDALTTHELRQLYLDWREALIEPCPDGDLRVRYPESNNDTRSEGVGYGMVIAAYMGDQQTFDGLWNYYQRQSSGGLMNWRRNGCGGDGEGGSAADADIDAALALIVADRQFPGAGYAQDAATLLGAIRGVLFDAACQGVLLAGSQFRGCDCINPSYIPPGYYVAYGSVEQQAFWTQARDASYDYYGNVQNPATGLVPAWSQVDGNLTLGGSCTPVVPGGGATSAYQADAARTPWRVATDYQWTGDPRAQAFLQSVGGFANEQEIMRVRDSYTLQGQRANGNDLSSIELGRNTYVMGGFATAMVATTQENLDEFTAAWMSVYKAGDNYEGGPNGIFRAFNNSLALLYGLVLTGTMWNPAGADPTAKPEATLTPPTPGNVLVNGDFDEGVQGWSGFSDYYVYPDDTNPANNPPDVSTFTSSDGFSLHQNGEMHLRVVRNEPANPNRLSLRQGVALQAGRYRLAVDARSTAARPLSLSVSGGGGIVTDAATGTFTVDAEMRTYQTVFEVAAATNAELRFDFGQSAEEVIVDNVILEPTQLPVDPGSAPGGLAPPVGTPAPGTPPAGGGAPAAAPGDGTLGTVGPVGQDPGSASPLPPSGTPGAAGPASPASPPTNAASPSAQNCAPAAYSVEINLCYDPATGYVWDATIGDWTLPPPVEWCGVDERNPSTFYYWWPLLPACYDRVSGYAWNQTLGEWVFVGKDFVQGRGLAKDDGGCTIGGAGSGSGGKGWPGLALLGLAGIAMARRRR